MQVEPVAYDIATLRIIPLGSTVDCNRSLGPVLIFVRRDPEPKWHELQRFGPRDCIGSLPLV